MEAESEDGASNIGHVFVHRNQSQIPNIQKLTVKVKTAQLMWTWQPACALNYLKLQFSDFSYCVQTEVEGLVFKNVATCCTLCGFRLCNKTSSENLLRSNRCTRIK